jgi:hypothetical protein
MTMDYQGVTVRLKDYQPSPHQRARQVECRKCGAGVGVLCASRYGRTYSCSHRVRRDDAGVPVSEMNEWVYAGKAP